VGVGTLASQDCSPEAVIHDEPSQPVLGSGVKANLGWKHLEQKCRRRIKHPLPKIVSRCGFAFDLIPVDTVGSFSHEHEKSG